MIAAPNLAPAHGNALQLRSYSSWMWGKSSFFFPSFKSMRSITGHLVRLDGSAARGGKRRRQERAVSKGAWGDVEQGCGGEKEDGPKQKVGAEDIGRKIE